MTELLKIIWQSLTLNESLWHDFLASPTSTAYTNAFWIVGLAGLAEAIAQSVVLFLNQVKPHRFVISLVVNAVIFVFGYFFYVISINLTATTLYQTSQNTTKILSAVSLAYAPLMLSFLIMVPYFGRITGIYLNVYHFLALIIAVKVTYALEPQQALICVVVGWLVLTFSKATVGRPLIWLARFVRNRAAGTKLITKYKELIEQMRQLTNTQGGRK